MVGYKNRFTTCVCWEGGGDFDRFETRSDFLRVYDAANKSSQSVCKIDRFLFVCLFVVFVVGFVVVVVVLGGCSVFV